MLRSPDYILRIHSIYYNVQYIRVSTPDENLGFRLRGQKASQKIASKGVGY